MYNDSIETLLLRHYGNTAPTPAPLEQRLVSALQHETRQMRQQQHTATRLSEHRVSRRRVVQWVALGSAGLGVLSSSLESLQSLETNLLGQEVQQPAFP